MEQWKLTIGTEKGEPVINIYYAERRYRFRTGKAIGLKLTSIKNPELLKSAFELKLLEGWCAEQVYANAPWSDIGHKKKPNFSVELVEKKIKRDIW